MISRRQGEGDASPRRRLEEADDAANKVSQRKRIGIISIVIRCLSLPFKNPVNKDGIANYNRHSDYGNDAHQL